MSSETKNHTEIRGQAIICFLIAALAFVPAIAGADTYIYGPTVIDSPGTYVLMSDVLNYNGTVYYNGTEYWEPCFKILASDVVLDGNGHTITGVVNSSRTDYYLSLGLVPDQDCIMVNPGLERVHVKNFRILGEFDVGIDYYPVVDGLIENNELSENTFGIFTLSTNNVDIIGNTATGNRFEGIFCQGYYNGLIQGNTANNNEIGIYLLGSNFNTIDDNIADSNSIDGINDDGGSYNTFSQNTANTNAAHGINLTSCHHSTVQENIADSNGYNGIFLWYSTPYQMWTGITVDHNHAWSNGWDGINLTNSSYNIVSSNSVEENEVAGISLNDFDLSDNPGWDTTENLVVSNEAHRNGMYGIISRGASGNTYRNNHVSYNPIGIDIGEVYLVSAFLLSDVNLLEENVVHNNEITGIYVHGHDYVRITSQNVLTGNEVTQNDRMGIHLAYANAHTVNDNVIYGNGEVGMQVNASAYNNIYNNCFNNTYNVAFGDMIFQNTWNVLKQPGPNIVGGMYLGGNYWAEPDGTGHSQVTGPNADEFCNLSLYLASLNVDNFPLWNPLNASFTTSATSGNAPLTVQFTDTSLGNPTCWIWDFGDGSTSTDQNPSHTYTVDGVYTVTFSAYRCPVPGCAGTSTATTAITVGPNADFTATPTIGPAPLTVTFTDISTVAGTAYFWDFGDGSTSTEQNPVHEYQNPGIYGVSFTVTGTFGTDTETKSNFIDVRTPLDPIADFTASPQSGDVPLTVDFIDLSTGDVTSWAWDFTNDGSTDSTERNPTYTYTTAGDYTVELTVTNTGGTGSKTLVIHVENPQPYADFIASPRTGYLDGEPRLTVYFYDRSTGTTPTTQYLWDFGDGSPQSMDRDPVHNYTAAGSYDVHLWVTNPGPPGTEKYDDLPIPDYIIVSDEPIPVASIVTTPSWTQGPMPFTVDFHGISTYPPSTWLWTFGDGSSAGQQDVTHTFTSPGQYKARLRVFDEQGRGTEDAVTVVVEPVADFAADPMMGDAPLTVQFTDLSQGNPDWFYWEFDDGTTSWEENPVHLFIDPGTYYVEHWVQADGVWSQLITRPVVVGNTPAIITDPNPPAGYLPLTVDFEGIAGGYPVDWLWEFGDGLYQHGQTTSHYYPVTGYYTVTLTVYYNDRDPVSTTRIVAVRPVADFTESPADGIVPLSVQFTDTSQGSITSYFWMASDGWTSTARNPSHTFTQPGFYNVYLTVSTVEGLTDTKVSFVQVRPLPKADFTASPRDGIEDLTVQFYDTSAFNVSSWIWNFGDGATSTLQSPAHTYSTPGWYDVALTVSNAQGQNSITKQDYIYVRNYPPVAAFDASPKTGDAPLNVQFTDASTGSGITSWQWNFGDGGASTTQSPLYVYNTAGTYTVTLTVANDGGSDPEVKTNYITVNPAPPANIIKLYPGWNFVSAPKRLASGHNTAIQVFGGVDLGGRAILLWDASTGLWKQVLATDVIQPLNGYWVYSVNQVDIPLTFDTVTPPAPYPKQLYTGWNAIGYAGTTSMSARNFLTLGGGLNGNWDLLLGFHDGIIPDTPIIRDSNDGLSMYPTKGYWIAMNSDDTLTVVV